MMDQAEKIICLIAGSLFCFTYFLICAIEGFRGRNQPLHDLKAILAAASYAGHEFLGVDKAEKACGTAVGFVGLAVSLVFVAAISNFVVPFMFSEWSGRFLLVLGSISLTPLLPLAKLVNERITHS